LSGRLKKLKECKIFKKFNHYNPYNAERLDIASLSKKYSTYKRIKGDYVIETKEFINTCLIFDVLQRPRPSELIQSNFYKCHICQLDNIEYIQNFIAKLDSNQEFKNFLTTRNKSAKIQKKNAPNEK